MARPREFDYDQTMATAISVFNRLGYHAVTTDDLRLAMGIGRQSFYSTFGGKRQLFLAVLQRYTDESVSKKIARLQSHHSAIAAFEALLSTVAEETEEVRLQGCLGINTRCVFTPQDSEVEAILRSAGTRLHTVITLRLQQAIAEGELSPIEDISSAATFIQNTLVGITIAAKTGIAPEALRNMASFAIGGLRHQPRVLP
ncbi:TetR/AcrR family transcriptional regulator [Rouxiella sp. Mn2063]|uniref:TetR/AcrR family transcriptional regulator n=1 Tax=Rouxiella sp. Mn2063 TaxID=3395262 RepID=UPI003BD7D708